MASINWNYKGIFPNDAETHGAFWGYRGLISYIGDPYPRGVLSGLTEVTTPTNNTITCISVNTFGYSWQKSTDGTNWTDIPDEFANTLTVSYALGQHGTYHYRCICYGLLGRSATGPITITVSEPTISTFLTPTKSTLEYGEETVITCFIIPYLEYAKSYKWQTSTDGTTWTDIAESTLEHHFTGTRVGTTYFRVIATQYDDVEVTSNEQPIVVNAPEISVSLTASATSILVGESSTITCTIAPTETYAKSFRWQTSTDGSTWTDIAETGLEHVFTGETAGTTHFRVIAVKLDDVEVTSDPVQIEVTEPPTP